MQRIHVDINSKAVTCKVYAIKWPMTVCPNGNPFVAIVYL